MANNNANHPRRWATIVIYRECVGNYTTHGDNGCGAFTSVGDSLFCAVCGCHRVFHRKEEVFIEVEPTMDQVLSQMASAAPPPQLPILAAQNHMPPPPAYQNEDENPGDGEIDEEPVLVREPEPEPRRRERRERVRLTMEQREMMRVYGDMLGWSLQGHDEEALSRFCADIGIVPRVFKVWMNNNRSKYFGF